MRLFKKFLYLLCFACITSAYASRTSVTVPNGQHIDTNAPGYNQYIVGTVSFIAIRFINLTPNTAPNNGNQTLTISAQNIQRQEGIAFQSATDGSTYFPSWPQGIFGWRTRSGNLPDMTTTYTLPGNVPGQNNQEDTIGFTISCIDQPSSNDGNFSDCITGSESNLIAFKGFSAIHMSLTSSMSFQIQVAEDTGAILASYDDQETIFTGDAANGGYTLPNDCTPTTTPSCSYAPGGQTTTEMNINFNGGRPF